MAPKTRRSSSLDPVTRPSSSSSDVQPRGGKRQRDGVVAEALPRMTRAKSAAGKPPTSPPPSSSSADGVSASAQRDARRQAILEAVRRNLGNDAEEAPVGAPLWADGVPAECIGGAPYIQGRNSFDPYALEGQQAVRELERSQAHALKLHSLRLQPDIDANMRSILVDWLIKLSREYKLSEETLHLAVQYLDRFLSLVPLRRSKLQLVGVTCAWVAAKYEERLPPPLDDFVEATAAAFQRSDLVRMEGLILSTLRFNLSAVTPASFVRRFTALMPPSVLCRDESLLARYVLELALQDQRCLKYLPSALGAAALCLGKLIHLYRSRLNLSDPAEDERAAPRSGLSARPFPGQTHLARLAREALSAVQLSKYAARDLWPCVTHLHELAVAAPERLEKASWEKASILLGAEQLVPPPLLPPIDAVLELPR
mmetsp:Transcript_34758/g.113457  ORF Transcript_34758/g.113457 Transcript_34758/m.113457 type:complete len:427 (-) Transcript_34758:93-1373(-)